MPEIFQVMQGVTNRLLEIHRDGSDFIFVHGPVQKYNVAANADKVFDFFIGKFADANKAVDMS